jgi:hypothetical protein
MDRKYTYNLNSHAVWGSFDYGEVWASSREQALHKAKLAIMNDVDKMNELLKDEYSIDVDCDGLEVKEEFVFWEAFERLSIDFSGFMYHGYEFQYYKEDKLARLIKDDVTVLCTPFVDEGGILVDIHIGDDHVDSQKLDYDMPRSFDNFEKFLSIIYTVELGRMHELVDKAKARLEDAVDCGVDKLIEIRSFKIKGIFYEVHVDATEARSIFEIFPERGVVTAEIREKLEEAVNKIEV